MKRKCRNDNANGEEKFRCWDSNTLYEERNALASVPWKAVDIRLQEFTTLCPNDTGALLKLEFLDKCIRYINSSLGQTTLEHTI